MLAFARLPALLFIPLLTLDACASPPPEHPNPRALAPQNAVDVQTFGADVTWGQPAGGCVSSAPEICFDGADNNCNGLLDEGCGLVSGRLEFVVAWPQASVDIDLLVYDPSGELTEPAAAAKSGLRKPRDCPGRKRACGRSNFEQVYLAPQSEAQEGQYRVLVRLEKLEGVEPPVVASFFARLANRTFAAEVRFFKAGDEAHLAFEL